MTCAPTAVARSAEALTHISLYSDPMFTDDELEESTKIQQEAKSAFTEATKNLTLEALIHEHESRLDYQ